MRAPKCGLVLAIVVGLIVAATWVPRAQAQSYNVLYTFSGCTDGNTPTSTLVTDRAGSLYGTTQYGGTACGMAGQGLVFRLKRVGSGWVNTPIHTFVGGSNDGEDPVNYGGLTIGPDGSLYGTAAGGGASDVGVVFRLRPPATACVSVLCPWSADILHSFSDSPDGADPFSNVAFDSAGNLYGTTFEGGQEFGVAYELTPSGGGWTEDILYDVGDLIAAGLTFDRAGNLYGVTMEGGLGLGTVFQLTPSGSGWTQNILHTFSGGSDGADPVGGLVLDQAGNFYGTTASGANGGGTVFQLSPSGSSWTFTTIYRFSGSDGPFSTLTIDAAGNLYGTTLADGAFEAGSVFKLTPSGGSWAFTDLHDFQSGNGGISPIGGVTLDSAGNLYGTTSAGGVHGAGVVWEIAP
ncbi:MAG: choice-of-anchor tandem repeat GloVer-containing protein [Candidatus Korobacteraceae bacterium]